MAQNTRQFGLLIRHCHGRARTAFILVSLHLLLLYQCLDNVGER